MDTFETIGPEPIDIDPSLYTMHFPSSRAAWWLLRAYELDTIRRVADVRLVGLTAGSGKPAPETFMGRERFAV